jgi:hypothetical protein
VRRIFVGSAAFVIVLATSAVALAGGSSLLGQYGGAAGQVQNQVVTAHSGVRPGGTLPFTGLDLALVVAAGIVLVLTGWLIRRAGRAKA